MTGLDIDILVDCLIKSLRIKKMEKEIKSKCCGADYTIVPPDYKGRNMACEKCMKPFEVDSFNVEEESWEKEWNELRSTVIVTKDSTPYNSIIDISAMEKRDIDFIKDLREKDKEGIIKMCEGMKKYPYKGISDEPDMDILIYNQALQEIISKINNK
jgi:hypothetical protein